MLDRTVAPHAGQVSYKKFIEAKRYSHSGIPIFYLDAGEQPVIKLQLRVQSGVWYESHPGESWFVAKMLLEGTKTKSSYEISETFQSLGAFIEVDPGFDDISINVYGLKKNFEQVIVLFKEILLESVFPQEGLELLKQIRLDELRMNNSKTSTIASKKIRESLFGLEHSYGRSLQEEDVAKLTKDQLFDFYQQKFFNSAELFISGRVDETILKHVESLTIDTQQATASTKETPVRSVNHIKVDRSDNLQSSIKLAWHIPNRSHENYFDLSIANTLLGGYFGSRLMKNIREEKGYTYGISSYPIHLNHASFLIIGTDVKAEFAQATVDEVISEIKRLVTEPTHETEIETLINYMSGNFDSSLSTPFKLMSKFLQVHKLGESYDYYERYFDSLQNFNAQKLSDAVEKYLNPDEMHQVIVGP